MAQMFSGSQILTEDLMNNLDNGNEDGQSAPQQKIVALDERALSPVTIKQLLNAPPDVTCDGRVVVDGVPVVQINIMARIVCMTNLSEFATEFMLCDDSGSVYGHQWVGAKDPTDSDDLKYIAFS